jgi:putative membrane protein insertion efficiency factor
MRRAVAAVRRLLGATVGRAFALLLTGLVLGYRRLISPMLGQRCRFYPSCSAYALEAIRVHGATKGTVLATARVCRCHPWNPGGVDHVPAKGAWKPEPYVPLTTWDTTPSSSPEAAAPMTPSAAGESGVPTTDRSAA